MKLSDTWGKCLVSHFEDLPSNVDEYFRAGDNRFYFKEVSRQ